MPLILYLKTNEISWGCLTVHSHRIVHYKLPSLVLGSCYRTHTGQFTSQHRRHLSYLEKYLLHCFFIVKFNIHDLFRKYTSLLLQLLVAKLRGISLSNENPLTQIFSVSYSVSFNFNEVFIDFSYIVCLQYSTV